MISILHLYKHSIFILPENIIGQIQEFHDNTVLKNGELEKQMLNLQNETVG